jgi:hypothetical protein
MSAPRAVRCYQTIDRPFRSVAAVLRHQPFDLLQRATSTAAVRAASLAANLRVEVAGLEVGVRVRLCIRRVRDFQGGTDAPPAVRVELTWDAIRRPGLFPSMLAELTARPLSESDTRLEIDGSYWTPMGALGTAIDAVIGHRIAEASTRHFLEDVAAQLRNELPPRARGH